jgi:hypothetical protein
VTVTLALPLMSKIRLESLPLTASLLAPGPLIVTLAVIGKSLASVMVPCSPLAKLMVSPLLATPTSDRNEPEPLSDKLDTVKVLSKLLSSSPSNRGRTARRERVREPDVDRRTLDSNNMMQAFLDDKRSAEKTIAPWLADLLPGLVASIHSRFTDCRRVRRRAD